MHSIVRRALVITFVILLPLVAWARSAERLLPGQKLFGEMIGGETVTVLVDCVEGTTLAATSKAFKGTNLRIALSLASPQGAAIDLTGRVKTNSTQTQSSFSRVVLPATGSYRLSLTALSGTGGFDLAVTGSSATKRSGEGVVAADLPGIVEFDALPGDKVACTVKRAKGSSLKPLIHRFVDAGGAQTLVDLPKQPAGSVVATLGRSRFEITGAGGTAGGFKYTLKFTRAKAPKAARDVEEVNAVGRVTGVVVIDGQVTRSSVPRSAKKAASPRAPDVRVGEIVVSAPGAADWFAVAARAEASMPGTRCTVAAALSATGPYLVQVEHLAAGPRSRRAKSATRALAKTAAAAGPFLWAEPNAVVYASADANDPLYPQQFHLRQLRLQNVWNRIEGSPDVVVAIVDTGRWSHFDLTSQWLPGYDFVYDLVSSGDTTPGWDPDPTDDAHEFHGLHVAGIVGARTNNKSGVAGVVWQTRLLPVRVLGKDGGTFFDVAAGLRWAAGLPVPNVPLNTTPARVINMSLGSTYDAQVLREAVLAIVADEPASPQDTSRTVLIAAAGNEGTSQPTYPAAYPGFIAVYALDSNLDWASYSNFGNWISVGAPGGDPYRGQAGILSTFVEEATLKPNYQELSGTSMAAPQIAGVAALLIAAKPSLTPPEIKNVLERTALDLGPPGFDIDFGWGMVNAEAALDFVLTPFAPVSAVEVAPASLAFEGVDEQAEVFVRTKSGTPVTISAVTSTADGGGTWLTATADQATTPATVTVSVHPLLAPGSYTGKVRLTTSVGVVDVPVRAVRAPRPKLQFVVVTAERANGTVVAQTTTTAAKNWEYDLPGLPIGQYRIRASSDQNLNLTVDRVDEFEGLWPLLSRPQFIDVTAEQLDGESVNVPMDRYDARFSYAGVGAGGVTGAIAVRATDARTGLVVAGAKVHLGSGTAGATTDARGRGLAVGSFGGGQVVSVVADGYATMTRVAANAQFQAFALEPLAPLPSRAVTATVRGLSGQDNDVWIQIGDATAHAVWDRATDPVFQLAPSDNGDAFAVSAVVFAATGEPTRRALYEIEAPASAIDVQTAAIAIGAAQARFVQPALPSGVTAPVTLSGITSVRWSETTWLSVGRSPLIAGQSRQAWFADPGVFDPPLPVRIEARAADNAGRTLRRFFYGTTTDVQVPFGSFTFDAPPALVAPSNGATGATLSPTLQWNPATGAKLHKLTIEHIGNAARWTVWVDGAVSQIQLPLLAQGGLTGGAAYRWNVETYRFAAGFDASNFREERLEAEATSRGTSNWFTFTTQ